MTSTPGGGGLVQSDLDPFYNDVEYDYEFVEANLRLRLTPTLVDQIDLNGNRHSFEPANFDFSTVGFPLPADLPEHKIEIYYEVLVEKVTYVVQQDGDRDEVSRQKEVYYPTYTLSDVDMNFTGATKADEDYTEADTSLWPFTGVQPYEVGEPDVVVPALMEEAKAANFDFTNTTGVGRQESPLSVSIVEGAQIKYWRLFTKNRGSYIPRQTKIDNRAYKNWADNGPRNTPPYEVFFNKIDTGWPATPSNPETGVYPYYKVVQVKPDQRYILKARFHLTFTLNANQNGMGIDLIGDTGTAFGDNDYALDVYLPVEHPKNFDWQGYIAELQANGEQANGIEYGDDRYNRKTDGKLTPVPPEYDPTNPDNYK